MLWISFLTKFWNALELEKESFLFSKNVATWPYRWNKVF